MSETSLVSVVIPLYNKARWVRGCIESVLSQTHPDFEILIVNDGSTDDSLVVAQSLTDPRIHIMDKPNGGVSSARNLGLEKARGEYIAFIDADDTWCPKHLEILLDGFCHFGDTAIVANRFSEGQPEKWNVHSDATMLEEPKYSQFNYLNHLSSGRFSIHIGSSLFPKTLLDTYKIRFFEHLKMGEDVNFLLRASMHGKCMLSNYIGLLYCKEDLNGAMNLTKPDAVLTPNYFYGIAWGEFDRSQQKQVKRFLRREYLKMAYQNRKKRLRKEELEHTVGGGINIGKWSLPIYLTVRYTPEFLWVWYRQFKTIAGQFLTNHG